MSPRDSLPAVSDAHGVLKELPGSISVEVIAYQTRRTGHLRRIHEEFHPQVTARAAARNQIDGDRNVRALTKSSEFAVQEHEGELQAASAVFCRLRRQFRPAVLRLVICHPPSAISVTPFERGLRIVSPHARLITPLKRGTHRRNKMQYMTALKDQP